MLVLGIDPSLNNVGWCLFGSHLTGISPFPPYGSNSPDKTLSQFERMMWQVEQIAELLDGDNRDCRGMKPTHVGIEQPYVQAFSARGNAGHQSANMWAIYNLLLQQVFYRKLPVLMFNIPQLRALILRKRGMTKADSISRAQAEINSQFTMNEHEADAYHVAKNAFSFWSKFDGLPIVLTPDQNDIFLSDRRTTSSDLPASIIHRGGEFWFDFRKPHPSWLYPETKQILWP